MLTVSSVLLSAILSGLSFIYPNAFFLVWFSLVPLFFAIRKAPRKKLILYGLLFGICFYSLVLFWVNYVTILGFIVLILYLSLYPLVFVVASQKFLNRPMAILSIPSLWILIELLQEHIWCGFGWANLGYSQYNLFKLIQIADLFGVKGVSFLVVMSNVALFNVLAKNRKWIRDVFILIIAIGLSVGYSQMRPKQIKSEDSIAVSIIQPNISEDDKWDPVVIPGLIQRYKTMVAKTDPKTLVILPEAAWPQFVPGEIDSLYDFTKKTKRDILMGTVFQENDKFYNGAFLFDKGGELIDLYRKIKLVPFGEYVPLRKYLEFIPVLNMIGDMSQGDEITEFEYKNKRFAVLICFEDLFPLFVAKAAKKSDFLINITNDEWFGGEPQAHQHLAIMIFRAIENRISIIRCANTGMSGWVSFKGKPYLLSKDGREVFFIGQGEFVVSLNKSRSFYNKFVWLLPLLSVVILIGAIRRKNE